ncbi:MAG: SIMPL domain-containing protein [Pseudohongiella sp.]|uniref:SIMPL domain-containing protein n=1 Tax=Pseudohongiella sp. TaxID=1979412 RepID=UPI0034A0A876
MTNRKSSGIVRIFVVLLISTLGFGCSAVQAQQALLPEGQTMISLSVTERISVAQDLVIASLRIEVEDRDASAVQNRINAAMEQALQRARDVDEVSQSTGYYNVYQYDRQPEGGRAETLWRGSQSLTLQGKDAQALLTLAGELQEMGFLMNQLSYQLSTERADEVRDSLMEAAIARATQKAERAAAALGKSRVDIAVLDVDTSSDYPAPMMMRAMADTGSREMTPPSAEPGETEVTLNVRVQAVAQ